MYDLQNPHTVAYYASLYEAEQAEREFSEAFAAHTASGARYGSAEDYAMWSVSGYYSATLVVFFTLPVWEA